MKIKILILFLLLPFIINSQKITGRVMIACMLAHNEHNHSFEPLSGALVINSNTSNATTTDANGYFSIDLPETNKTLIIKMLGYKTDTIFLSAIKLVEYIYLKPENKEIEQIVVTGSNTGQITNSNTEQLVKTITATGLKKLPCCNLSESFENSADVDVSYSDAVSGTKQIQMLGLSGKYTQILTENIPTFTGISQIYGLSQIPGSWLQSIQVSKGTSSVVNGFEAIAGQINVELKKPDTNERFFFNLYTNSDLRAEANLNTSFFLNKDFGSILFAHFSTTPLAFDMNKDGFADEPLSKQFNFLNRWKYETSKFEFQIGFKVLFDDKKGGQIDYLNNFDNSAYYGIDIKQKKYEAFMKIGAPLDYVIDDFSFGSTFFASKNYLNSIFGKTLIIAQQSNFYGNIIFEKHLFNDKNKLNFGPTLNYRKIDILGKFYQPNEQSLDSLSFGLFDAFQKLQLLGFYAQYTYSTDKFSIVLGYRYDFSLNQIHENTMRMHIRYKFAKNTTLRASVGNGVNFVIPYLEQINLLANNRIFASNYNNINTLEKAWNFGASLTKDIYIGFRKFGTLTIDAYRTFFNNQVVTDIETPQKIFVYNLNGQSYSNSYQIEFSCEPFRWMNFTTAFKYNDVKQTIANEIREKPFVNKFRGLLTISLNTLNKKWFFDVTNQFVGKSRIPSTITNLQQFQREEYSPNYYLLHFQVSYRTKKFEFYTGCENATNFTQQNPIIAANEPYGKYFDATLIWGPLMGRKIFAGLRYKF